MKTALPRLWGLLFIVILASCAGMGTPSTTLEPTVAPTNRPPALSRVAPASLPEICNCVLRFDHISIEQGLSQSSVRAILQDSRGFMWFGTEDGLNRYDGYNFKTFKPDPDVSSSLSDRWINAILEDEQGLIWVATGQGGISRYDPSTQQFTRFVHDTQNPSSLSDNHVNVLYKDKDGRIWIGTHGGLDLFNPATNSFKNYAYEPPKSEDSPVKISLLSFRITAAYFGLAPVSAASIALTCRATRLHPTNPARKSKTPSAMIMSPPLHREKIIPCGSAPRWV